MSHVWGSSMISAPGEWWITVDEPLPPYHPSFPLMEEIFVTFIFSLLFFFFYVLGKVIIYLLGAQFVMEFCCHLISTLQRLQIFLCKKKVIWWVFDFSPQLKWEGWEDAFKDRKRLTLGELKREHFFPVF